MVKYNDRSTSLYNPNRSSFYWDNLGLSVGRKVILSECSGTVYSGQVIGIFGASGCGKSTFLNCLSGRVGKGTIEGSVLFNGRDRIKKDWKSACAFVEQDEVMYRHLTVRETLIYAAEFKLPSAMSRSDKIAKVDFIINELSLTKCQNTRIGDPDNKGISGGERKRVAIGIEMISDPEVFLLDEPTSGLDAFTAINIIRTLKEIGMEKKRITLMTVHQPRNELLNIFDSIIILAEGKVIFSGRVSDALTHFQNLGYHLPPHTNPADFFLDISSIDRHSSESEKDSIKRIEIFQSAWKVIQKPNPLPQVVISESISAPKSRSWIKSFLALFRRNFTDMIRDRTVMIATVLQTMIVMLFIGFFYKDLSKDAIQGIQNRLGAFVFMGMYNAFMNVLPTVLIFPHHRQVIRRERAAGSYSASAAYLAKLISLVPLCWITSLILSAPLPFFMKLKAKSDLKAFLVFIFSFLVQSQAACSFGLMVGAGVSNGTHGLLIAFPILIVMFLLGGILVNLSTLPPALYWLQFLSIIANCTKSVALSELPGLVYEFQFSGIGLAPSEDQLDIIGRFGLGSIPAYACILINAALSILFSIIGYLLFRYTAAPNMNLGKSTNTGEGKSEDKDSNNTGIRSISDPRTPIEIPLGHLSFNEDRDSNGEQNITISPVSEDENESLYGARNSHYESGIESGKKDSLFGLYGGEDASTFRSSTLSEFVRMPRRESKEDTFTKDFNSRISNQQIPNNDITAKAKKRRSLKNSVTFSDLDYYDTVN